MVMLLFSALTTKPSVTTKQQYLSFLITLGWLFSGCTSTDHTHAHAFADTHPIGSVFIMPIVLEITQDSDTQLSDSDLATVRTTVTDTLRTGLEQRGHGVILSNQGENTDFTDEKHHPFEDLLYVFLSPRMHDYTPYYDTLQDSSSWPPQVDRQEVKSMLFVKIKSHIVDGYIWEDNDESSLKIWTELINLSDMQVVTSPKISVPGSDVLDLKRLKKALAQVLVEVPINTQRASF